MALSIVKIIIGIVEILECDFSRNIYSSQNWKEKKRKFLKLSNFLYILRKIKLLCELWKNNLTKFLLQNTFFDFQVSRIIFSYKNKPQTCVLDVY